MADRTIQVRLGTNTQRKDINVQSSDSLRSVLENNNVDYGAATVNLDGSSLSPGDMDKSFDEMGITGNRCMLVAVVKSDNA